MIPLGFEVLSTWVSYVTQKTKYDLFYLIRIDIHVYTRTLNCVLAATYKASISILSPTSSTRNNNNAYCVLCMSVTMCNTHLKIIYIYELCLSIFRNYMNFRWCDCSCEVVFICVAASLKCNENSSVFFQFRNEKIYKSHGPDIFHTYIVINQLEMLLIEQHDKYF